MKTVQGDKIQVDGNILHMVKAGKDLVKCFLMAPIDTAEQNRCKFTFVNGDVELALVSLG